jgi:SAM-dependent methyltransferase
VFCGFALFFLPYLAPTLAEFRRALKPRGRLAVTTWGRDDERWAWLGELSKK